MCNSEDLSTIANRIKQRRTELNLSLQDIADMTDMSKSTLQRYETGSIKNIPLQKLGTLARALQTSADWLLGWVKSTDEITTVDIDIKTLLKDIGYHIEKAPYSDTIYFMGDIGSGPITKEEYNQLRDSIASYAKFNSANLLQLAAERENTRVQDELKKMAAYTTSLTNSGNRNGE